MGRSSNGGGSSRSRSTSSGGGERSTSGGMGGSSRGFSGGMNSSSRSNRSKSSLGSNNRSSGIPNIPSMPRIPRPYSSYSRRFGGGYRDSRGYGYDRGYSSYGRRSSGLLTKVMQIIITLFLVFLALSVMKSIGGSVGFGSKAPKSTIERVKLQPDLLDETDFIKDELGWIKRTHAAEKGMRGFLRATGVQPFVYLTDNINGSGNPNNEEVEKWLTSKYSELFTDEAHALVLILDNGNDYGKWILTGFNAKTVIDSEATDIIHHNIDRYFNSNLEDEEMISEIFLQSANTIMTVSKPAWPKLVFLILVLIAIVVIVYIIFRKIIRIKELEIENEEVRQRRMTTHTESFDPDDISDLFR